MTAFCQEFISFESLLCFLRYSVLNKIFLFYINKALHFQYYHVSFMTHAFVIFLTVFVFVLFLK